MFWLGVIVIVDNIYAHFSQRNWGFCELNDDYLILSNKYKNLKK